MSKRRMFSQLITENDAFLDMPLSTQALYFHLGMSADDDGFVSPKRVMRMIGANDDDLKILLSKRYVLYFESGVVVVKHWKINNFVRSDRYMPTTYKPELDSLTKNEFGAYTEIDRITTTVDKITDMVDQTTTNGIPNDIPTVDLGKVRLGKVNKQHTSKSATSSNLPKGKYEALHLKLCELFEKNPNQYKLTDKRRKLLNTRLKSNDIGEDGIIKASTAVSQSRWHMGDNDRGWSADPYWVLSSYEKAEEWITKYTVSNANKKINLSELEIE